MSGKEATLLDSSSRVGAELLAVRREKENAKEKLHPQQGLFGGTTETLVPVVAEGNQELPPEIGLGGYSKK